MEALLLEAQMRYQQDIADAQARLQDAHTVFARDYEAAQVRLSAAIAKAQSDYSQQLMRAIQSPTAQSEAEISPDEPVKPKRTRAKPKGK